MIINYTKISKGYNDHRAYSKDLIKAIIKLGKIVEDKRLSDLSVRGANLLLALEAGP